MEKIKIFIIILHYGDIRFTLSCLKSLKKINKDKLKVKIGVICNTLINQSERKKLKSLTDIIIQNKRNLGFAKGNNIGIRKALKSGADYVLLLNNDTIVYKNFLLHLIKAAEEYLDVGIVGPTIKHKIKGQTFYDYGGVINWKLGKPFHINKTPELRNSSSIILRANLESSRERSREASWSVNSSRLRSNNKISEDKNLVERDFVSGCCMLIKKEVFEKIGFLNEKYFLYLEDVEFCVRAKKAGFTILLNPNSCIFHFGSSSTSELKKILYSLRNSLKFTWDFVPFKFKPIAFIYSLIFYPAIFTKWQLSRLKRKIFQKGRSLKYSKDRP